MKAICARIVAAAQVPAGPEREGSEQPSSSQTLWITNPTPRFILQEVFLLHLTGEYPFHLKVILLLTDHSEKVGQVLSHRFSEFSSSYAGFQAIGGRVS